MVRTDALNLANVLGFVLNFLFYVLHRMSCFASYFSIFMFETHPKMNYKRAFNIGIVIVVEIIIDFITKK